MPSPQHRFLNLAAMEALRHVRLRPRGAAEGTFAGPHKSHYRGTAVEFADYREYTPGDDIRMVDWKVFARTDRHYVRLYDAERNLLTYLVVDKSGSMEFAGAVEKTPSKLEHAARLVEAEGGAGKFNVEPAVVRTLYRQRFDAFLSEMKANCQARGCDWFLANTAREPYGFLRDCFLERENGR